MSKRTIVDVLNDERIHKISGGLYHKLQIDFAYNSNRIEGSKLTHDQTRYIFETQTIGLTPTAKVDDIIETTNHFICFDYVLQNLKQPLDEDCIKTLHRLLKTNTFSSRADEAVIGDYKKYPNEVINIATTAPEAVKLSMHELLEWYQGIRNPLFDDILDFHVRFEKIHPFYDGNGRVGRLIMFRECLKNDIVPFFIHDNYKMEYYNGLHQWQTNNDKTYLRETCLCMQDHMKSILDYFRIDYVSTTEQFSHM